MEKHKELASSLVRTALAIKFSENANERNRQIGEMWVLLDTQWEEGLLKYAKLDKLMSEIGSDSKLKVECDKYWDVRSPSPVFIPSKTPFKEDMRELDMLTAQEAERDELEKTLLAEAAARALA